MTGNCRAPCRGDCIVQFRQWASTRQTMETRYGSFHIGAEECAYECMHTYEVWSP